jgi:multiple sugar transport system permease protein
MTARTTSKKPRKGDRDIDSSVHGNPVWRWVLYAVMIILAGLFLFPLIYMFASSFKPDDQVLTNSQSLEAFLPIPFNGLENYADAFERAEFGRVFLNSLIISAGIVGLGLIVNSLCGYALARLDFPGRKLLVGLVIALIIIPFEALAVPLLFMGAEVNWLDTYQIQILPFIANPLFIFLFYTFFLGLPRSLEEAARIDGAGPFQVFWRVAAPLAKPAYATVAILSFLFSWAQFLWPSIVTRGVDVRPLPVGIGVFQVTPPISWGDIMAYTVMMTLPLLIIFLIFQRQFVQGVASSGVKG